MGRTTSIGTHRAGPDCARNRSPLGPGRRTTASLAVLVLCLGVRAAAPAADEPPRTLAAALALVPAKARAGVAVVEVGSGEVCYARAAELPLPLASLTKLFVSAAALVELGTEYRFRTRLLGLGPVAEDGSLPGLCVVGGGDPCLDEHFTEGDPDAVFAGWRERLAAAGVRRIAGDLLIDGGMFSGPIRPTSYPQDHANQQKWYSAPASAFAWNDNCIEVRVLPGERPGHPAVVQVRPRSRRVEVVNRSTTATTTKRNPIIVNRAHRANRIVVSGKYGRPTSWFPLAVHAEPDLLAGDHLAALLRDQGIPVTGTVRRGSAESGVLLHEHRSPLLPALRVLNQRSQNFYGEQILRVIAHHRSGTGSTAAGCEAVAAILRDDLGMDISGLHLLDGSGLSHGNAADALLVARLLARMGTDPELAEAYRATLKDKWWGKVRCRVKTGTHSRARTLAGYIPGPDGRRYAFAILLDRHRAESIGWAIRLRAWIFRRLVDRWGCGN